jgi:hypothetical protein
VTVDEKEEAISSKVSALGKKKSGKKGGSNKEDGGASSAAGNAGDGQRGIEKSPDPKLVAVAHKAIRRALKAVSRMCAARVGGHRRCAVEVSSLHLQCRQSRTR